MVESWIIIYGVLALWVAFNMIWFNLIRRKTAYPGNTQGDIDMGIISLLSVFLGPILFLFLKPIRLYRKHRYLKKRINYYKWQDNFYLHSIAGHHVGKPLFVKEIKRLERIFKLSKLQQKTKRNKLKNKLLFKWGFF